MPVKIIEGNFELELHCPHDYSSRWVEDGVIYAGKGKPFDGHPVTSFNGVDGWLSPWDIKTLWDLAQTHVPYGGSYLEVGSYLGLSSSVVHSALRYGGNDKYLMHLVDNLSCTQMGYAVDFWNNVYRSGVHEHMCLYPHDSHKALGLMNSQFNMIFLDGDHQYSHVLKDIELSSERLAPGGVLCGHDYRHDHPGVVAAVGEYFSGKGIEFHVGDGSAVWYAVLG